MIDLAEPFELPFVDKVPQNSLFPRRWSYIKGAEASENAMNEPSEPYSINLDTAALNDTYDDEIRSNYINMAGASDVVVQYWTQHRGAEAGEALIVEYRNDSLQWVQLDRVESDGVDQDQFEFHAHKLRANSGAYHNKFRLRLRTEVDQRNDDFFIDDIRINNDPAFVITIESDGATDVPIEVSPAALFGNGNGTTPMDRQFVEGTPLELTAPVMHLGIPFAEWQIDGAFATSNQVLAFSVTAAATATAVYGSSCDPCDANCDGSVDAFDIETFINVLGGATPCSACAADVNGDGVVDAFDIEPFINCLAP
jgi:hypothetical protein